MTGLRGFGVTVDLATGRMRNWYAGADGIRRWDDTEQIAHAVKDPNGLAYNRTAHLAERAKMMQEWADYLSDSSSIP